MPGLRTLPPMLVLLGLCGCAVLPAAAPTTREITYSAERNWTYAVIDIDAAVAEQLSRPDGETLAGTFPITRTGTALRIGPGDVLQIAVLEPGGSTLFSTTAQPAALGGPNGSEGKAGALLPVTVGSDGYISVPFAGRLRVANSTLEEARVLIQSRLRATTIKPQVMLNLVSNVANTVVVGGEVAEPRHVPLNVGDLRLLDVLVAAGGSKHPAYETIVRVTRAGRTAEVYLQRVIDEPSENIYVAPGDEIYLTREPATFTAFGAAGRVGHYAFESVHLTLAEAIAKAGGLIDGQADLTGVFLFRGTTGPEQAADPPVVYRLDLQRPESFLYARQVQVRDKDIILVANAEGAQLLKMFTMVRGATGVVSDLTSTTSGN